MVAAVVGAAGRPRGAQVHPRERAEAETATKSAEPGSEPRTRTKTVRVGCGGSWRSSLLERRLQPFLDVKVAAAIGRRRAFQR